MALDGLGEELLEALPAKRGRGFGLPEEVVWDFQGRLHGPTFPYLWAGIKSHNQIESARNAADLPQGFIRAFAGLCRGASSRSIAGKLLGVPVWLGGRDSNPD